MKFLGYFAGALLGIFLVLTIKTLYIEDGTIRIGADPAKAEAVSSSVCQLTAVSSNGQHTETSTVACTIEETQVDGGVDKIEYKVITPGIVMLYKLVGTDQGYLVDQLLIDGVPEPIISGSCEFGDATLECLTNDSTGVLLLAAS